MKQESADQTLRAVPAVAGAASTWALHDVSMLIAILVGVCTIIYTLAQLAFLLRRWWLMEKCHVVMIPPSAPMPLNEQGD